MGWRPQPSGRAVYGGHRLRLGPARGHVGGSRDAGWAVAVASYLHSLSQGLWGTAGSSGGQSCFGKRCPRVLEALKESPAPLPVCGAYTTFNFLLLGF